MSTNSLNPKILVVGGAGYIGSHTNLALLEAGFETVVFDDLSGSTKPFVPSESEFFKGNILNPKDLKQVFEIHDFAAVIHFAGKLEVGESVTDPAKYYEHNIIGTLNLLAQMQKSKVNKLVFSSTAAIFGLPESVPIKEGDSTNPINPYGNSKLMVEQILSDYAKSYDLSSISLRYFNASGADKALRTGESRFRETHLIPVLLKSILSNQKFTVFGKDYQTPDGTCIRDYVHVTDLAKAHVLALQKCLETNQAVCEKINLGTKTGYSVKQILDSAEKVTNQKVNLEFGPRRLGDPDILVADNTKSKEYLGWEPTNSSLENIIATAWEWELKLEGMK